MTTGVPIVKTNGTGNEFVLVDERVAPVADHVAFAREVCDPERGVGADGVLFVQASDRFDARLRIVNADGSDAEMCGNGMRCVGRYLDEHDGRAERDGRNGAPDRSGRACSRARRTVSRSRWASRGSARRTTSRATARRRSTWGTRTS